MCYSDDARPPAPPVRQPVGEHGDLVLTSADGTRFAGYAASPAAGSGTAFVILPDVRGLHPFYRDLALRFAEAGHHAVAIDYFGRTASTGERGEDFPYREHMERVDFDNVDRDVAAAAGWLRGHAGIESMFTVGFCFGGAMSWRQSGAGHGLAGCVGLYGIPSRVADRVDQMSVPLLMLAAGNDFTPVSEVEKLAAEVRARGVEVELAVYPGAPHSFFDRSFDDYSAECADAWTRVREFIATRSGPRPA